MDIVQRVEQRHALHVVVEVVAMVGTHPHHIHLRHTPQVGVAPVALEVAAVLVALDHVGQKQGRLWRTILLMCERSRQFVQT